MRSAIYLIINTTTKMFYVGSAHDYIRRWDNHKYDLRLNNHCNPYLQSAWNKYGEGAFAFRILEVTSKEQLEEREQYWIDQTKCTDRTIGYNLCPIAGNVTGRKATEETKALLSTIRKGKIRSEETKAKIRATMKGRKFSEETREKMRQAQLGKKKSEEFKELRRNAMLGNQFNTRRKQSEDEIIKRAQSNTGKKRSDEARANISESLKGRFVSEESRLKMSLAAKKRWHSQ